MDIVIIGNGAAGVTAAQKLRELDSHCNITLISKEKCTAYAKIMLPDYVGNKLTKNKMIIRDDEFYSQNNIKLLLDHSVIKIDTKSKKVMLSDKQSIKYDKMLIATGASVFVPKIKGIDKIEKYTINSMEDAETIKMKSNSKKKVLVVGAGLAGVEMALALEEIGMNVTLVERENRILPTLLDESGSSYIGKVIRKKGIKVVLGRLICEFVKNDNSIAVLDNDDQLSFDFGVFTIGTRPDLTLFEGSGIKCNRGVLVDSCLKTSVEDVYAAGDVAEIHNEAASEGYVSCYVWSNAMEQGKCAAVNILGQLPKHSFKNIGGTMIQLRDIPFVSTGLLNPKNAEDYGIFEFKNDTVYKKVILKDDEVKGFICYGDNKCAYKLMAMLRKSEKVTDKSFLLNIQG